jgi:hypothetical protein
MDKEIKDQISYDDWEFEMIEKVKSYPHHIRRINNPSEAIQLAAVTSNPRSVHFIKKPTEKVKLAVVRQNGRFIENFVRRKNIFTTIYPSEAVQIEAVKNLPGYYPGYDNFVKEYINSTKAIELYNKLKKVRAIIK